MTDVRESTAEPIARLVDEPEDEPLFAASPDDFSKEAGYTIALPDGLSAEFRPSRTITPEEYLAWECGGAEPYAGFDAEYDAWEAAWNDVDDAQTLLDGDVVTVEDVGDDGCLTGHVLEWDERTGTLTRTDLVTGDVTTETTAHYRGIPLVRAIRD
ncbi:hypothetical protein [Bifidobacterium choloepi]|uniref:Uncharacterized protein n=1 Tax=Bifidobacterium choloepi TaxID=2614131 RepID=A0A6I5NL89_9BIFI|nr:hypothetical protein [Bifidobacterium choloepi]NEG69562.1 hypothetical protein [Bifidobacterium choloepi]